ncbi:hypothetical protein BT63DRAFT_452696 [Microthyrium microscopicum]|uniref:Uncharacterized protein n=1 Tax=Microthyrium microscopicum TaxID=703497 RepID=A0A6A6UJ01_9PEZI|nr:hypothetical protein BT63DRAFT_452696 [Microthyrium microscopicum]
MHTTSSILLSLPLLNHATALCNTNIFMTGISAYHPTTKSQGFNPAIIDTAIRADAIAMRKAGYNVRRTYIPPYSTPSILVFLIPSTNDPPVVLIGPEQPLTLLESQLADIEWAGTGVGFGVRGSKSQELTTRFEDIIQTYRKYAPSAPMVFNAGPQSVVGGLQRLVPLADGCVNGTGRDLGIRTFCEICGS